MTKANLGRKGIIWLTYPQSQAIEGYQGRDPEARAQTREACRLLDHTTWLAQHAFLGLIHPRNLGPPVSITNYSYRLGIGHSYGGILFFK